MATAKKTAAGTWRIQVFVGVGPDGKKIKKSFTAPTKREAEKLARDFVDKKEEAKHRIITVKSALKEYIEAKRFVLSPSTIHGYETILHSRLQSIMDVDIYVLDSFMMQKAINEDAKTKKSTTIREAKNLIVTAMRMFDVKTEFNVTFPAEQPNLKDLPTAEQVFRMIRGTDIELPCLLAMWLSLRISEVRGLQFGDIRDGILTVQRSRLSIGNKDVVRNVNKTFKSTRRLVVPPYIMSLINKVPRASSSDFIIQVSYQVIHGHLKKLCEENGYHMTFHDLRHLNASVMLMLGIPDKYAMERGGWSTNSTLKAVYQHTFAEERKKVDERIDGFFEDLLKGMEAEDV